MSWSHALPSWMRRSVPSSPLRSATGTPVISLQGIAAGFYTDAAGREVMVIPRQWYAENGEAVAKVPSCFNLDEVHA